MAPLDECFEALGSAQRRRLLLALLESNPRDDTPAVTEGVTDSEGDADRALVQYHHVHLPKLERYGLVDWDREAGQVTKGPSFGEIRRLLELLRDEPDALPGDLQ